MDRWSWTISIPGTPSMVPVARTFVRAFLGGHPLVRDAELIASEYVTNTIRHTASGEGGVVHVTVASTPHSVRIEVTDHGPAGSEPVSGPGPLSARALCRSVTDDDESGRGLLIVDFLATRWGHYGVSGGHTTAWAVLGETAEDELAEAAMDEPTAAVAGDDPTGAAARDEPTDAPGGGSGGGVPGL